MKEHEQVEPIYLKKLKNQIKKDGILKVPIIVDKNTFVVLDGHFRINSLKKLGYSKIVAFLVDYNSPKIVVQTWRNGETITKEDVLKAGLTGKRFPVKSSKHVFNNGNGFIHISEIVKRVDISLEELK